MIVGNPACFASISQDLKKSPLLRRDEGKKTEEEEAGFQEQVLRFSVKVTKAFFPRPSSSVISTQG